MYACISLNLLLILLLLSAYEREKADKRRESPGEGGVEGVVGVANCPSYALNFLKSAQVV